MRGRGSADAKIGGPREGRHHHPPRPRGPPPHQGGALTIDAYRTKKRGERRGRGGSRGSLKIGESEETRSFFLSRPPRSATPCWEPPSRAERISATRVNAPTKNVSPALAVFVPSPPAQSFVGRRHPPPQPSPRPAAAPKNHPAPPPKPRRSLLLPRSVTSAAPCSAKQKENTGWESKKKTNPPTPHTHKNHQHSRAAIRHTAASARGPTSPSVMEKA